MSGFEYAFVSDVAPEYFCPICECVMREPVQTKCGHRFCKHCLETSMKRKRKCPIDRRTLDERSAKDIYPDVAIERTILDFIVKCPNERYGCQWTGELRTIETHQTSCSFVGVKCTNKDCEETFLKKDLNDHLNNKCPKRKVECHHCKRLFVWCTRQDHFDACTKYPMDCLQGCREKIARDQMDDHIEESCLHTKVQCTFTHVGCQVKVQRKAIQDHLKRNTESHWKLVCDRLQELQVSSTSALANMKEMQNEISTVLKKIKDISEAVLQSGGLEDLRHKIAVTNKKLEELQSREDTTDMLSGLQSEVVAIKKEVEKLSRKVANDRKLMELPGAINQLQKLIPKIDNLQGLRKEVSGINKKLQKLQEAITSLEKQKSDAELAIYDDRRMLEQIEQVEWQLRREVSDIRQDLHRDRMQMQNRRQQYQGFPDLEGFKNTMVIIALCSALIVWSICDLTFVKKEKLQDFQQKFWYSIAKLEQSNTYLVDRTHFLQDESDCKTEKFLWSFTYFRYRLWQAKTGLKLCFFSEPFFTEPYGYRMCIAVCPNGNPVQNTHLAVFVYLLRSNNDHLLPWPFQQKVAFILVDQQDAPTLRKNITAVISPKKMPHLKESAFAKPNKESSYRNTKGFGYNKFISHIDLQKRLYIRDGTILVQLEVYPMHCDKYQ